jgi:hypothetical protein
MLLFIIMLSVCSVIGVAPVFPKRKEQFSTEIKIDNTDKKENAATSIKTSDNIHSKIAIA